MSRFRELLYLDDATVERLLVDGAEEDRASAALTLPESPERKFRQLWAEIRASDETVVDGAGDTSSAWDEAEEGRFCEFTGTLSVPSVVLMLSVAQELRVFLQLGQQLGFVPISGDEDEQLRKMAALRELIRETYPVILTVNDSQLPVILPLDANKSRVRTDRFIGSATVYGRVVARTSAGETVDLIEIPGLAQVQHMSRQQRRASTRSGQHQQPNDMVVRGPALRLRVLAIQQ